MSAFTFSGQRPRVTWEDLSLPHQIRLSITGSPAQCAVSCTCMGSPNTRHEPLATRDIIEPAEALAIWRAHVAAAEHTV